MMHGQPHIRFIFYFKNNRTFLKKHVEIVKCLLVKIRQIKQGYIYKKYPTKYRDIVIYNFMFKTLYLQLVSILTDHLQGGATSINYLQNNN